MKKYIITLEKEERAQLLELVRKKKVAARTRTHAHVLLQADSGPEGPHWTDKTISEAFTVHPLTVANIRRRCGEEGGEVALQRRAPRRQYLRKLEGTQEAHLIALACSDPPLGQKRWTLRLLRDKFVELEVVESLCHETVRQTLKKMPSSHG
jgi:Homeodomain-like domain